MKAVSFALAAAAALAVSATACEGLKEAMTAHVDTAARAGSQELSVDRLAKLLDEATVPPRKDVANAIANAWVDYQLLAQSAATGDTAVSPKEMQDALWAPIAAIKARKYYELVSKSWGTPDTAAARQMYANGDILAASHILLLTKGASPDVKAKAKAKADALRSQANASNFASLAKSNSEDPASAARGGSLGLFRRGSMVPDFEKALLALKPGQISPVIETEYGYHIIRRPTFDEVEGQLVEASKAKSAQAAESSFVAKMQQNGKIQLRSDAAATARVVIADPDAHAKDNSTVATSTAGTFTAGELARWLQTVPPVALAQQRAQLQSAPDSIVDMFVKNFVSNDLVLKAADSAHVGPSPDDIRQLENGFMQARAAAWQQLGVDPKTLSDSAKTQSDKVRFAANRIDQYMDRLVSGQAQFVQVAEPISRVLREKSQANINSAGIDRAVERAVKDKSAADSSRHAAQPPTAVPMPGGAPSPNGSATPVAPVPPPSGNPHQ